MTTLDIIIIAFPVLGALIGLSKGLLKQLASLLGLVVGLLVAKMLYMQLAEKILPLLGDGHMTAAQILAFAAIWIAVPILFALLASLLTKALEIISLGWLNRLFGAALGAVKYGLLACILIGLLEFIDADNTLVEQTTKQQSVLYYPMNHLSGMILPVAEEVSKQIMN
ncbi:MAG: CvpA family protein [Bacteroides sp.]|nr:CvpA family protein [Bacteroides sp.]